MSCATWTGDLVFALRTLASGSNCTTGPTSFFCTSAFWTVSAAGPNSMSDGLSSDPCSRYAQAKHIEMKDTTIMQFLMYCPFVIRGFLWRELFIVCLQCWYNHEKKNWNVILIEFAKRHVSITWARYAPRGLRVVKDLQHVAYSYWSIGT